VTEGPTKAPARHAIYLEFHGVCIEFRADETELLDVLELRFQHFLVGNPKPHHIRFDFTSVASAGHHVLARPSGMARPVYEPPEGEVVYSDDGDWLFITTGERVRVLAEIGRGEVRVSFVASGAAMWLVSHPIVTICLIELLKRRGLFNVHAAGLSSGGRSVLIPGPSGVGKSTISFAMIRAGFDFIADDMVFLHKTKEGMAVLAFPDTLDFNDSTALMFSELEGVAAAPKRSGWPKWQIDVARLTRSPVAWRTTPVVLVFPTFSDRSRSELVPIGRDDALTALLPNVLLTEARSSQAHLDALGELVAGAGCFRLEMARDFPHIADLLRSSLLSR